MPTEQISRSRRVSYISPKQCQKSLAWWARIAITPQFQSFVCTPLVKAIVMDECPKERKEALPLPLYVVAMWEQCMRSTDCNDAFCVLLRGYLLAIHASFRFGDLQRIRWDSIALSWTSLRGTCWATKTTLVGQPFTIKPFRFCGRDAASSWIVSCLSALSRSWDATSAIMGDVTPDFMLPSILFSEFESDSRVLYHEPMSLSSFIAATIR